MKRVIQSVAGMLLSCASCLVAAQTPALPTLPELDEAADSWEEWGDETTTDTAANLQWQGFAELLAGIRTGNNPYLDNDMTAAEVRLRGEVSGYFDQLFAVVKLDATGDQVTEALDLELREALLQLPVGGVADVRLGRQILTWGTGDLLFVNDLFPKDWQALLAGRDMEYLKAPADALKLSFFSSAVNLDLVWLPRFSEDNYLTGERFSYFSPLQGRKTAAPPRLMAPAPDTDPVSDEVALRLFRQVEGLELALYGYQGYYRQPQGYQPALAQPYFPALNSVGMSVRGTLERAIVNFETAYYDSVDDRNGTNPYVPNSQWRYLFGVERELVTNLSASLQFYVEKMADYHAYKQALAGPAGQARAWRQVYTLRLTEQRLRGNWTNSLFVFYSPSERDYFVLPEVRYRLSDTLHAALGGRVLGGQSEPGFFAAIEENSNVYARLRLNF